MRRGRNAERERGRLSQPVEVSQYLTCVDVAELLKVSQRSVRQYIHDGKMPVCRLGRAVRISSAALAEFVSERTVWKKGDYHV